MSRNPVVVIASLVFGLVAGFAGGWLVADSHKQAHVRPTGGSALSAEESSAVQLQAAQAARERDEAKKELERVKADLVLSQDRIASLQKPPSDSPKEDMSSVAGATGDEEKQKKLAEVEKAIEAALAKGDGKEVLRALKDLAALGEPAFPRIAKLLGEIFKDLEGDKKLKIDQMSLYMLLSSKAFLPYSRWELANTDLPTTAREGAVMSLGWSGDPGAASVLASDLKDEKDRLVAKAILGILAFKNDEKSEQAILDTLDSRRDNKQIRMDAVNALWQMGDDPAMKALQRASQADPDADVREAARIASQRIDPPIAGYMVNYIDADSGTASAGLKRGDIILSYDGEPVQNSIALTTSSGKTEGRAQVPVQVYRDGQTITLNVKGGAIEVWGQSVKPKH